MSTPGVKFNSDRVLELFSSPLTKERYIKNEKLFEYCIRLLRNTDARNLFGGFLEEYKERDNSFYLYFSSFFTLDPNEKKENFQKAMGKDNAYAIVDYADMHKEDLTKKEIEDLYLKAYNLGYYKGMMEFVDTKFTKLQEEEFEDGETEESVTEEILAKLPLLEELNVPSVNKWLMETYRELCNFSGDEYIEQYVKYCLICGNDADLKSDYFDAVVVILKKYFKIPSISQQS